MLHRLPYEITFDDILLLPGYSSYPIEADFKNTSIKTKITNAISLDIPIVSAPIPTVTEVEMALTLGRLGGMGFIHPFQPHSRQLIQVEQVSAQRVPVAACVTELNDTGMKHVGKLLRAGVTLISVETAHAYNKQTISFIRSLKKHYRDIQISVALVVTAEATEALIKAGADNIRIGIGGGSHCTTRLVTGVGRPQLSAVRECCRIAKKYHIPVISDTGIRYAGDITKAIAFGADAVMIGGLFSGTDQAPGPIIRRGLRKYKASWGMCTTKAYMHEEANLPVYKKIYRRLKTLVQASDSSNSQQSIEEGVGSLVSYKGNLEPIINTMTLGLRRSMWYLGARTIADIQKNTTSVVVSSHTIAENLPRI